MQTDNLLLYASALARQLAEGKTLEEINWLSALLIQLGGTLDLIAAQKELCDAQKETADSPHSSAAK